MSVIAHVRTPLLAVFVACAKNCFVENEPVEDENDHKKNKLQEVEYLLKLQLDGSLRQCV